jgi:hypothetical protein
VLGVRLGFGGAHRRFAPEPVARLRCHYRDIVRASRLGDKASVRVDSLSGDWSVAPPFYLLSRQTIERDSIVAGKIRPPARNVERVSGDQGMLRKGARGGKRTVCACRHSCSHLLVSKDLAPVVEVPTRDAIKLVESVFLRQVGAESPRLGFPECMAFRGRRLRHRLWN